MPRWTERWDVAWCYQIHCGWDNDWIKSVVWTQSSFLTVVQSNYSISALKVTFWDNIESAMVNIKSISNLKYFYFLLLLQILLCWFSHQESIKEWLFSFYKGQMTFMGNSIKNNNIHFPGSSNTVDSNDPFLITLDSLWDTLQGTNFLIINERFHLLVVQYICVGNKDRTNNNCYSYSLKRLS